MENKNELKEIAIKNCTCYYFDDMNGFLDRDIDFNDIASGEKLYKKVHKYSNLWHFIQNFNGCRTIAY